MEPDLSGESSYKKEKSFVFDEVFDDLDDNISIYRQSAAALIDNVLNGFNATIFAYGMTGAGKTYTMFGDLTEVTQGKNEHGIVSMVVKDLFSQFDSAKYSKYSFALKLSYLEIYNEHTRDLLSSSEENLMIVEDPVKGVIVPSLSEYIINSHEEIVRLIKQGNTRRIMASTKANQFSSRSHAIIQLSIEKRDRAKDVVDAFTFSKFCLVDLAGSERAATTENRGLRLFEGANINKSLLALGNCINVLSDPDKKGAFVPYRDSKLTRLLKDSLGGNTKTIMIACISPSHLHYDETVNTLKYASRARNIKRNVRKNQKEVELHVSQYREIIDSLRTEIDSLRNQLAAKDTVDGKADIRVTPEEAERMKELSSKLEGLEGNLFRILEEHWEIKQTVMELEQLQLANEEILRNKEDPGASTGMADSTEIQKIKENMINNEQILAEARAALKRNLEEKQRIQQEIANLAASIPNSNSVAPESDMTGLCHMLKLEKIDLINQNAEIKEQAKNLARETVRKDREIEHLQREMEKIKQELAEKVSKHSKHASSYFFP